MTTAESYLHKPSAPDWLVAQLPKELAWGQRPIKLSMKDAPADVVAISARLNRIVPAYKDNVTGNQHRDSVLQIVSTVVVNRRDNPGSLPEIPAVPIQAGRNKPGDILVGTYRIDLAINYRRHPAARVSQHYHGLEKGPAA